MRRPDVERIEYDAISTGLTRVIDNTAQLVDYIGALETRVATLYAMLMEEVDRARQC